MEYENDGDTNSNWCTWFSHQRIGTGTGSLGNKKDMWGPYKPFLQFHFFE